MACWEGARSLAPPPKTGGKGSDRGERSRGHRKEGVGVVMPQKFYLGDVVRMKKPHPCGDDRWEVLRTGMDFRMKCLGCGRVVMLPRRKFERGVKEILKRVIDEG